MAGKMIELLDSEARNFCYDEIKEDSTTKSIGRVSRDAREIKLIVDEEGAVSDCFLLYAVCSLYVANLETIRIFLNKIAGQNKELRIMSMDNADVVRARLVHLSEIGFLVRHSFALQRGTNVVIYTAPLATYSFVNQKLSMNLKPWDYVSSKPLNELVGLAASSYVLSRVSEDPNYIVNQPGFFKTPAINECHFSGILKMKRKQGEASIGFFSSYLHFNKNIQRKEDYTASGYYQVNRLQQFFYSEDRRNHYARAVVVVENLSDLKEIAKFILMSGNLLEDLDRIYFTGEGIIRSLDKKELKKGFFNLAVDASHTKFDFKIAAPDFLS